MFFSKIDILNKKFKCVPKINNKFYILAVIGRLDAKIRRCISPEIQTATI